MYKLLDKIFSCCYPLFKSWGLGNSIASYTSLLINIFILSVLSIVVYRFFRLILVKIMEIIARKTKTKFDDLLISNKTVQYIAYLIPLLFIYKTVPIILKSYDYWEAIFGKLVGIYIILLVLWIIRTIFNALRDHLKSIPKFSDKPIDSYVQVIMIILWMMGITVILSEVFEIKIEKLLTTLGAISAIILLIFRDTILGLVASIQVSVNDMVRIGDWITMEKFGADGDVIEINLATVKVRNFDYTTTTIPTYSLISESFKNWRGMQKSEGRRIKRHILIKSSSVRFIENEELENLKKIQILTDYIEAKKKEIETFNLQNSIDKNLSLNGRNLTNLGLFRKYIVKYLENQTGLNKKMHLVCRQLQPTSEGVPLEIYVFSKDKKWENYEYLIADIFDHIIASVPYFGLEIFELPSEKIKFPIQE
jgi:miniconductance mechanosensitive channel